MHHPHLESGGRYPVLRTLAVLYMAVAAAVLVAGVWQSIRAFSGTEDALTTDLYGPNNRAVGRLLAGFSWLGVTFISSLVFVGVAELMKLFIDIEHNTRVAARQAVATASAASDGAAVHEGRAIPFVPDRKILEGDETAEGALLRGH